MGDGRARWVVIVSGLLALGCASGAKRDAPVVTDLRIRGARAVPESAIKKRILTSETGWWPLAPRRYFDPVEWQTDLARIDRFYEARGYYDAEVVDARVIPKGPDRVALEVRVVENQPVRIGALSITGLEGLTPRARRRTLDDLPLERGAHFREQQWEEAKRLVRERLRDGGHAEARVEGLALVDVRTDRATLRIASEPGPVYRFGEIDVQATGAAVPPEWIREQVRLAMGRERRFSDEAVEEAERRVFAMGVFSTARVTTGTPDPASGTVPLVVEAREGPTHTLRLGGGAGVDQIRQEVRLVADWTDRNFGGGLRRLSARAVAGWAFLPSVLAALRDRTSAGAKDGLLYRAGLELEQPRLFGRPSLRLRSLVESERTLEETFDAIGGRGLLGVTWQPTSRLTIFPSYQLQAYYLEGPSAATVETAPLALGCTESPCFIVLSYLEQVLSFDTRDNPLEPRRGLYLSLSLQEGGGPLRGDFSYLRLSPEARGYLTVGDDREVTFAAKLRVGTLITGSTRAEESPVVSRFTSGGSQWMRGFGIRRLSPLLLVPASGSADPQERVALPIGGNGLVEGSFEARSRFTSVVAGVGFLDFGTVTPSRSPLVAWDRMMWAVGFGVRYLTPVGPVRLDLAFRLPVGRPPPLFDEEGREITYARLPGGGVQPGTETGDNVNKSCFGIGGGGGSTWVKDSLCALHVSIGEAF